MPSSDIGAAALGKHLPLTRTVPLVGRSSPAIIRIVVDFPAPFGPRKPVTTPGSTTKLSPSTAVLSPYRFVKPSISIMSYLPSLVADVPRLTGPASGVARGSPGVRP